ncbi:hypothetical protein [Ponticaulis sp.]|uniref:hypothetical protein n=1 Tax=Ponticaulis sp. TaxID=2020902 RepID=UPI000C43ABDB|nr:hypothetical protein [Ponticaulis sp.]MBN03621.1 hypothetical protein [Ponticaulis sp.]
MKYLITTAASVALLAGTASAQLGSVTSDTTGQLGSTIGNTVDLQSTIDTSTNTMIDRDSVVVNGALASDLQGSLSTYEIENAGDTLGQRLRSDAEAMRDRADQARENAQDRAWGTASRINTRVEETPAPVTVYTRDGAQVGTVDRMDNGMIYVRGNGQADAETMPVAGNSAAFHADANAVVLDANEAEFRANVEASAGSR